MKLKKILILAVLSCSTTKANCHTASCAIEGTPNQGLDFWLETFDQIAQEILKLVEEKGIKLSDLSQNDLKEIMTKVKIPKHLQDFIIKGLEDDLFKQYFEGLLDWIRCGDTKSCEQEGRESANSVCNDGDSVCKERVHNNTRDKCQEHERAMERTTRETTDSGGGVSINGADGHHKTTKETTSKPAK